MDDLNKGIIRYSSRDYNSIMNDFWELVPKMTELWKPEAEADPGVVLGKFLASAADMLGLNLDWAANELYAPSVTQRKNAEKLFGLIGYELGWYTAARTEVTFTNNTTNNISLDFSFNNNANNFATLNAYTDITDQARVITYNVLPSSNSYGANDTRNSRQIVTSGADIFSSPDIATLHPGESTTRVAIEGELRSYSISVAQVKQNNYIIHLPSQHIDTTAIWIRTKSAGGEFVPTQWVQCTSPAEFIEPEPRFSVTYDAYSNAQIQVSNYLDQLENYASNYLVVYWVDCSGVIGCVGEDVLSNLLVASSGGDSITDASGDILISNLSNTVELPNTYTVTGKSPETAREAYTNSRKYINTWDSLITLPDFNRFLVREAGVDCGLVIDCQKALEINLAIYKDKNLTDSQKSKMYITNFDFPSGSADIDWSSVLKLGFDPTDPQKYVFAANFKTYTAMCFAIHNDFKGSSWGQGQVANSQIQNTTKFIRYKPPVQFIDKVIRDYMPLQAMSVELEFGYLRIFPFYVVGTIYPNRPVSQDVADNIIATAKEALAMYFSPANRQIGDKPTLMEIVDVIRNCDSRINYFDAGSSSTNGIIWKDCDIEFFNPISFARYEDSSALTIRVSPDYIID